MHEELIAKLEWRIRKSQEFLDKYGIKIDSYGYNAGYDQAVREEILWLTGTLADLRKKYGVDVAEETR